MQRSKQDHQYRHTSSSSTRRSRFSKKNLTQQSARGEQSAYKSKAVVTQPDLKEGQVSFLMSSYDNSNPSSRAQQKVGKNHFFKGKPIKNKKQKKAERLQRQLVYGNSIDSDVSSAKSKNDILNELTASCKTDRPGQTCGGKTPLRSQLNRYIKMSSFKHEIQTGLYASRERSVSPRAGQYSIHSQSRHALSPKTKTSSNASQYSRRKFKSQAKMDDDNIVSENSSVFSSQNGKPMIDGKFAQMRQYIRPPLQSSHWSEEMSLESTVKKRKALDEDRPLLLQHQLNTQFQEATNLAGPKKNSDLLGLRRQNNINPYKTRIFQKKLEQLSPKTHKLVFTLIKKESERSIIDNEMLVDFFTKVPAFAELGLKGKDLLKVVSNLNYQFMAKGKTVFKKGDYGDIFYIILKGEVNLLMTNPQVKMMKDQKVKLEQDIKDVRQMLTRLELTDKTQFIDEKENYKHHLKVMKQELQDLTAEQNKQKEVIQQGTFLSGDSFGELSMIKDQPRAGTCVTKEDTHFAIVTKETYDKLIKRMKQKQQKQLISFLRQVPYIKYWPSKEILSLSFRMELTKFPYLGQVICKEGQKADKFIIIKSGQFEIVKTNLRNVFFNQTSGIVNIKLPDGQTLKSTEICMDVPTTIINNMGPKKEAYQYIGTDFQVSIQGFLNSYVKTNKNFKEIHRSINNQTAISQVKVCQIGNCQTFGDADAIKKRDYVYTLRTASTDCEAYVVDAQAFVQHTALHNKQNDVLKYAYQIDEKLVNQLARALTGNYKGMQINNKTASISKEVRRQSKESESIDHDKKSLGRCSSQGSASGWNEFQKQIQALKDTTGTKARPDKSNYSPLQRRALPLRNQSSVSKAQPFQSSSQVLNQQNIKNQQRQLAQLQNCKRLKKITRLDISQVESTAAKSSLKSVLCRELNKSGNIDNNVHLMVGQRSLSRSSINSMSPTTTRVHEPYQLNSTSQFISSVSRPKTQFGNNLKSFGEIVGGFSIENATPPQIQSQELFLKKQIDTSQTTIRISKQKPVYESKEHVLRNRSTSTKDEDVIFLKEVKSPDRCSSATPQSRLQTKRKQEQYKEMKLQPHDMTNQAYVLRHLQKQSIKHQSNSNSSQIQPIDQSLSGVEASKQNTFYSQNQGPVELDISNQHPLTNNSSNVFQLDKSANICYSQQIGQMIKSQQNRPNSSVVGCKPRRRGWPEVLGMARTGQEMTSRFARNTPTSSNLDNTLASKRSINQQSERMRRKNMIMINQPLTNNKVHKMSNYGHSESSVGMILNQRKRLIVNDRIQSAYRNKTDRRAQTNLMQVASTFSNRTGTTSAKTTYRKQGSMKAYSKDNILQLSVYN